MLTTIIIVTIAFYWLLRESNYLRIRLPYGKSNSLKLLNAPITKPVFLLTPIKINANPTSFIPLEIPEFNGNYNIKCVKE